MNKNNTPVYLALATVFGILIGTFFSGNTNPVFTSSSKKEAKLKRLLNFIEKDYVDEVDTDYLLDGAITQMLGKLDPHSVYIPKENLQDIQENMQGKFVGIGVVFRMIKDSITVIETIENGPSMKGGIKPGDRILLANTDTLFGKKIHQNKIPKFLKGKPDTKVALTVYRKTTDSTFIVNITRSDVNIKSVETSYMITPRLGYIKIDRFARNTYDEFKNALTKLIDLGMTSLVLDLRGNGGGFIDMATKIVDEFLEDKKLIVFTKNNRKVIDETFATKKGDFEKGEVYVLIDENSASASEIVAGALQDNDKGTIIGRRSFGKGLVQLEMDLGDGSAVRLTTARYYTPTGRSIQKPYSKDGDKNYHNEFSTRLKNGELTSKDSIKTIDSLKYTTPKGKVVYGGGGITPDVFVSIDTIGYLNNFLYNSILNFSFEYVDQNRKELTTKWKVDSFMKSFDKDSKVFHLFITRNKFKPRDPKLKETVKHYLKASVANYLFGDLGFYKVINSKDSMVDKVLELESDKE